MPRPDKLFQTLLPDLRRQIAASFAPGELLPSQRALALMHGVGQSTVHRALHRLEEDGLVRADARRSWRRAGRPRRVRAALRVGVITRRTDREVALKRGGMEIYHAISAEAARRGVELVWFFNPYRHHPTPGRNQIQLARVPWNHFDVGLLLEVEDSRTLDHPALRRHNVLAVDQDAREFGLNSVAFDDAEIGRQLARHLFDLGHRRFCVSEEVNSPGWPCDSTWLARRHGFERAVARLGGVIRPDWRYEITRHERGRERSERMLQRIRQWAAADAAARPSAVFALDAGHAAELAGHAATAGLRVPRDLSIATVTWAGEVPLLDGLRLSVAQLDLPALARRTFEAAAGQFERRRGSDEAAQLFTAPCTIIPGESTRAPAQ